VWKKRVAAVLIGGMFAVAGSFLFASRSSAAAVNVDCPGGGSTQQASYSEIYAWCWLNGSSGWAQIVSLTNNVSTVVAKMTSLGALLTDSQDGMGLADKVYWLTELVKTSSSTLTGIFNSVDTSRVYDSAIRANTASIVDGVTGLAGQFAGMSSTFSDIFNSVDTSRIYDSAIRTNTASIVTGVSGLAGQLAGILSQAQQQMQGMGRVCATSSGAASWTYSFAPSAGVCPPGTTDKGPVNDSGLVPLLNQVGDASSEVEKALGNMGQNIVGAICGQDYLNGADSCLKSLFQGQGGSDLSGIEKTLNDWSDSGQAAQDCAKSPSCIQGQYGSIIGQGGPGIQNVNQAGGLMFGVLASWLPVQTDVCTLSLTLQFPGQNDELALCPPANIADQWLTWRTVIGWLIVVAAVVASAARIGRAVNIEVSA